LDKRVEAVKFWWGGVVLHVPSRNADGSRVETGEREFPCRSGVWKGTGIGGRKKKMLAGFGGFATV